MIQNPGTKPGIAFLLRGPQGTGKTMFGEFIGKLVGKNHFGFCKKMETEFQFKYATENYYFHG